MEQIVNLDSVAQYNAIRGVETLHPLVSVMDLNGLHPMGTRRYHFNLYAIYLKELKCGEMRYGRNLYDYQEGTLVFIAPGQMLQIERRPDAPASPKGWALVFHPDLIKGTPLGRHMPDYSFFSYDANEALHLSEKERQIVVDCFVKIQYELGHAIDKHSKTLITSNIELLLNYCLRFYDRQFITRDDAHQGVLEKFESLLNNYFNSGKARENGLPAVGWCAGQLNLSANYFSDLIRKETGKSAHEHIQARVIDLAKEKMYDDSKSVSEIAYELGFKYPQHFTRLFKQRVGSTPNEYRTLN
ncbi:transcriptional regulator [Niastella yeongjuensis]|uniref:Transcriptional regulator n=1 Tax=Niastella yeongjuensis TaxID=354355 RepID=A0A1V9EPK1_9BACT|nr:helix-turn-helix domain-containing protein [Niastella yeongjuensis]OQP48069.1 transcriptional regulator [Niastella yeongjuensis]SEO25553.1 Helix-turn-helix domain-containing protein [Niastella yeongjuensis]